MIEDRYLVEPASWDTDLADLRAVRERVFVVEQNVPLSEEWDEIDPRCHHVIARSPDGKPIGTGRLTPERKIGRMAVLQDWRGMGVGRALLRVLLEQARTMGYTEVRLHAQSSAIEFYRREGFEAYGEEFVEAGIRHRMMRMGLEPEEPPVPAAIKAIQARQVELQSREDARQMTLELLHQCKASLCLYSRDLDRLLLDDQEIIDAFRRIALAGRGADLRILVQNLEPALRYGHRLLNLAHRMTSAIQVRVPSREDLRYPAAFMLTDRQGYLYRPLAARFDGEANTGHIGRHNELQTYFNEVWDRAEPSPELRQLGPG